MLKPTLRLSPRLIIALVLLLSGCWAMTSETIQLRWDPQVDEIKYEPDQKVLTVSRIVHLQWGRILPMGGAGNAGERCIERRTPPRQVCYNSSTRIARLSPDQPVHGEECRDAPLIVLACYPQELTAPPPEEKPAAKAEGKSKK